MLFPRGLISTDFVLKWILLKKKSCCCFCHGRMVLGPRRQEQRGPCLMSQRCVVWGVLRMRGNSCWPFFYSNQINVPWGQLRHAEVGCKHLHVDQVSPRARSVKAVTESQSTLSSTGHEQEHAQQHAVRLFLPQQL